MTTDAVVRRSNMIIGYERTRGIGYDSTRGRGRPKLILDVVVKNDMIGLNLSEHFALDGTKWHKRIHVADPN